MHDDCVCALALAWRQASAVQPGAGVLGWMAQQLQEAGLRQRIDAVPWRCDARAGAPGVGEDAVLPACEFGGAETDIYREARRQLGIEAAALCARCGGRIGASRVSDGVKSWHPECR